MPGFDARSASRLAVHLTARADAAIFYAWPEQLLWLELKLDAATRTAERSRTVAGF